jgi:hypothetical protein
MSLFSKDLVLRIIHALADRKAADEFLADEPVTENIDIIGKGHGVSKTTTNSYGLTVTEDFGVGDQLSLHWLIPKRINKDKDITLHLDVAPVTSEVGKLCSFQLEVSVQSDPVDLSDLGETFTISDVALSDTALLSTEILFTLPKRLINNGKQEFHMRLTRIASSNDLAGDVALHHASMDYDKQKG